jgi:hypothetical protein
MKAIEKWRPKIIYQILQTSKVSWKIMDHTGMPKTRGFCHKKQRPTLHLQNAGGR